MHATNERNAATWDRKKRFKVADAGKKALAKAKLQAGSLPIGAKSKRANLFYRAKKTRAMKQQRTERVNALERLSPSLPLQEVRKLVSLAKRVDKMAHKAKADDVLQFVHAIPVNQAWFEADQALYNSIRPEQHHIVKQLLAMLLMIAGVEPNPGPGSGYNATKNFKHPVSLTVKRTNSTGTKQSTIQASCRQADLEYQARKDKTRRETDVEALFGNLAVKVATPVDAAPSSDPEDDPLPNDYGGAFDNDYREFSVGFVHSGEEGNEKSPCDGGSQREKARQKRFESKHKPAPVASTSLPEPKSDVPEPAKLAKPEQDKSVDVVTHSLKLTLPNPMRQVLDGIHPTAEHVRLAFDAPGSYVASVSPIQYSVVPMTQDSRPLSCRSNDKLPDQALLVGDCTVGVVQKITGIGILDRAIRGAFSIADRVLRAFGPKPARCGFIISNAVCVASMLHKLASRVAVPTPCTFAPHLLTEVMREYSLKTTTDVVAANTRMKALRITNLPLPDSLDYSVQVGVERLAVGIAKSDLNALGGSHFNVQCDGQLYAKALNDEEAEKYSQIERSMLLGSAPLRWASQPLPVSSLTLGELTSRALLCATSGVVIIGGLTSVMYLALPLYQLTGLTLKLCAAVLRSAYFVTCQSLTTLYSLKPLNLLETFAGTCSNLVTSCLTMSGRLAHLMTSAGRTSSALLHLSTILAARPAVF